MQSRIIVSRFDFENHAIGDNSSSSQSSFYIPAKYCTGTWMIEAVNVYPQPIGAQPSICGACIQVVDEVSNTQIGQNVVPSSASGSPYYTYDVGTLLNMDSLGVAGISYQVYLYFSNPATTNTQIGIYATLTLVKVR